MGALILLTGLPATGKSGYCDHLHRAFRFHTIKTDDQPEVIEEAVRSTYGFVERYCSRWGHLVIEWGFVPSLLPSVLALKSQGAKLVWFEGDATLCRQRYLSRVSGDPVRMDAFETQITLIRQARLPTSDFQIVEVFRNGKFRSYGELDAEVFRGFEHQHHIPR